MNLPVHVDVPLDYKELWFKLRAVLVATADQEAQRCASAKEVRDVRRAQGAHEMCRRIVAMMGEIVQHERGDSLDLSDDLDS